MRDVSVAVAWLRTTFLYERVLRSPARYRLALPPGAPRAAVDAALRDGLVLSGVGALVRHGLMATDEEGFSLAPTGAGAARRRGLSIEKGSKA